MLGVFATETAGLRFLAAGFKQPLFSGASRDRQGARSQLQRLAGVEFAWDPRISSAECHPNGPGGVLSSHPDMGRRHPANLDRSYDDGLLMTGRNQQILHCHLAAYIPLLGTPKLIGPLLGRGPLTDLDDSVSGLISHTATHLLFR